MKNNGISHKFRIALLSLSFIFLVACQSQTVKVNTQLQQLHESLANATAKINEIQINEGRVQAALESDIESDSTLQSIASESSAYSQNLKNRQAAVADLEKLSNSIKGNIETINRINLTKTSASPDNIKAAVENSQNYLKSLDLYTVEYTAVLEQESTFLTEIAKEDATYEAFDSGISAINQSHDKSQSIVHSLSQLTKPLLEQVKNVVLEVETAIAAGDKIPDEGSDADGTSSNVSGDERTALYTMDPDSGVLSPVAGKTDVPKDVVLFTFDNAPGMQSLKVAQTLKDNSISGIFFVNTANLADEAGREELRAIYDLGFKIGISSANNVDFTTLTLDEIRKELSDANTIISDVIGESPKIFRPPFGAVNQNVLTVAEEKNLMVINWTYGYDWFAEYQTAEALTDVTLNSKYLVPGATVLMHPYEWTVEALPAIIQGFKDKGYQIVDPKMIQIQASVATDKTEEAPVEGASE